MSNDLITPVKDGVQLNLRVSPGAKHTSIAGTYDDRAVRLKAAVPPAKGRANSEAEGLLASLLGVPRSEVAVTQGPSRRDKVVLVRGLGESETTRLLSPHLR